MLICISTTIPAFGQDEVDAEGKFIFRNNKVQLSTFYFELAPATYLSSISGDIQGFTNLLGGFILNNRYYISVFLTLSNMIEEIEYENEQLFVSYQQAGFKLGYMHRTDRMMFWRVSLAAGLAGGFRLKEDNSLLNTSFGSWVYRASVLTLESILGVGFNLLPWWRLYVDLGYRFMGPSDLVIDIADDNTITLMISFGFGNFRYKQLDN